VATFPLAVEVEHVSGNGAARVRWTLTYHVTLMRNGDHVADIVGAAGVRCDGSSFDAVDAVGDLEEAGVSFSDWHALDAEAVEAGESLYAREAA
jgi:hypothetical protein